MKHLFAATWLLVASPAARTETVALVGGTVWTGGPQGTVENGTLVIRDGKIAAVGAGVQVPAGARTIDTRGRFVMPGIIDAHSHSAIDGNVNECSDVITAEVRVPT